MIIFLRSKTLLPSVVPLRLIPSRSLKWLSTKSLQLPTHPIDHLRTLLNAGSCQKGVNYERALVSALKTCSSLSAISLGQQIHCLILKSGLESNTFIQNSLINMYAKFGYITQAKDLFNSCAGKDPVSWNIMLQGYVKSGRLSDARQLFDVMPTKDCVSYTTMIMGYARNDCWAEAVEVFKDMMSGGVVPNEVTMASLMSALSKLGGIHSCQMLHGLVIKLQIDGLVLISTNLLHMYCLSSSMGDAIKLFSKMLERNIVSWNVMLNGYSKAGFVDLARELFEKIPEKDVVSWGTMIDGYVQAERLSEALMLYRDMASHDLGPNDIMIVDLISACARSQASVEGEQIHGITIRRGYDSYDFIQATIIHFYAACGKINLALLQFEAGSKNHISSWNALITGYVRNGMLDQARHLFDKMPARDVFSWSSMISGYTQGEQPNVALELFHEMLDSGIQPTECTMVSVFSAIAALGLLEEGRSAHRYVHDNSIPFNDNLKAAVIDMYAKCGSISTALGVFSQIRDRVSTVSPWNAIICSLAMHGHAKKSVDIFSDLQRCHIRPNSITFIGVLTACCHAGFVDQGKRYFESMKSVYDIEPDLRHYGCMVDLLGRAGRLEEARELIISMPMKADVVIWGTLLAACRTYENVDIGEWAAENLARLQPSHGGGRVLLSNIYADAGRWDDVFLVRRAMQSQRITRSPGYSGIV